MGVVVITGANSGFGRAGAQAFARNGDQVVATMRDAKKSDALLAAAQREGLTVNVAELDVTRPSTFEGFVDGIVERYGSFDVLVNNAGIIRPGSLEDSDESSLRQVLDTNLVGPLLLTRAVLPQMRSQGSGRIIMISSLSGIAGLPGDVTYTASKFALEGASEALRHEVDRWGIHVALIEAGMYKTNIFPARDDDLLPDDYPRSSPYRPLVEAKLEEIYSRLDEAFDPSIVGALMVKVANSDGRQMRWPADAVAEKVLASMFAQSDVERDTFLRGVSGTDWWGQGMDAPEPGDSK